MNLNQEPDPTTPRQEEEIEDLVDLGPDVGRTIPAGAERVIADVQGGRVRERRKRRREVGCCGHVAEAGAWVGRCSVCLKLLDREECAWMCVRCRKIVGPPCTAARTPEVICARCAKPERRSDWFYLILLFVLMFLLAVVFSTARAS